METIYDKIMKKNTTIIKATGEGTEAFHILKMERVGDNKIYVHATRLLGEKKPVFMFIVDDIFNYVEDPNGNIRVMCGDQLAYIII